MPVAWRAPIAARRERPARSDLRRIRQRRALELAGFEEAAQEYCEPLLDRCPVVSGFAAPRVLRKVGNATRTMAEAADVIEKEILQRERADDCLAHLYRLGGPLL